MNIMIAAPRLPAAQQFARQTFARHRRVMVLHTDPAASTRNRGVHHALLCAFRMRRRGEHVAGCLDLRQNRDRPSPDGG
jgi:hypothetical protein